MKTGSTTAPTPTGKTPRDLEEVLEDNVTNLERLMQINRRISDLAERLYGAVPQADDNSPERAVDVGIMDQFRAVTGRSLEVLTSTEDMLSRIEAAV